MNIKKSILKVSAEKSIIFSTEKRKKSILCGSVAPNSGKSYIARSLSDFCILHHAVCPGSNRFMYQDCISKRLLILNEPFLDEASIELSKPVFEGIPCSVPVKNKADQLLHSTPVVVTSNTLLWQMNFSQEPALRARMIFVLNLQACDFLKDVSKALHPCWWFESS